MALELRAFASRKMKTGFLSSRIIPMEDVARAFLDTVKGTPLELFGVATPTTFGAQDGFAVTVHPAAEPFALIAAQHMVLFGATTSHAGPGYHAFLVGALDAVQSKLSLKWESQGAMDDNTGHVRDRDFPRLQRAMAQFLKAECMNVVAGKAEYPNVLGISPGSANIAARKGEILTQLGPRSTQEIARWSALEGAEMERAAASFYPWWGEKFDGPFFRGLSLALMWMCMRWAKPLDGDEPRLSLKALSSLNEAVRRGVPPPVPLEVMNDFIALTDPNAPDFPRADGIGYLRREHWVTLNGWAARVPASLRRESEQANVTVLRNDVFRVQISTGILGPGQDPGGKPLALGEIDRGHGFFPTDDGRGSQLESVARTPSANGPDRLCLMKIWMADETLRGRAEAVAESVTLVTPEGT